MLCAADSHTLFRSLHLSTWLSLETLTLGAGNLGIPAFREPQKPSPALTQTLPPPTDLSTPGSQERSAFSCPLIPLQSQWPWNSRGPLYYATWVVQRVRQVAVTSLTFCSTRDHRQPCHLFHRERLVTNGTGKNACTGQE